MNFKVTSIETDKFCEEVYRAGEHGSDILDMIREKYQETKLPIYVPKEFETAVRNFANNAKFLILIADDGSTKTLILEGVE